jgi:type II secretory pathway pseudopilin PulG
VEIVLALGVLCVLAAVTVISLSGWLAGETFRQGARDFETVLRMARADAINLARRVQLRFDGEDGRPQVLWEPQPLAEPGRFVDFTACTWTDRIPAEAVRVIRCQWTGESAYRLPGPDVSGGPGEQAFQPITFNPDGSSDSAVIELAPWAPSDERLIVIDLDGECATIWQRTLAGGQELSER